MTQMSIIKQLKNEIESLGANWNLFGKVDRLKILINRLEVCETFPTGWVVLECGQNLATMLWFVNAVSLVDLTGKVDPVRQIYMEDFNSPFDAIAAAAKEIKLNHTPTTYKIEAV
jgi:hypothetical protein